MAVVSANRWAVDAHDAGRDPHGSPSTGKPGVAPAGPPARRTPPPGAMAAAGVAAVLGIAGAFALLAMTAGNGTALESVHSGQGTGGDLAGGLEPGAAQATSGLPLPAIASNATGSDPLPIPSDQPIATGDPVAPVSVTPSVPSAPATSSSAAPSSSASTSPAPPTSTTSSSSSSTTSGGLPLPLPTLPGLG